MEQGCCAVCVPPQRVWALAGSFPWDPPQEELELLRFGPRALVAIPGGQRSSYDDQKGTSGCHLLQSPPKAGLAYH